jgi:IMP dehydrogenase/GMP reductase
MNFIYNTELDYKDIFIYPQYSEVDSRALVDTTSVLYPGKLELQVPVISANMDTVTDWPMARAMAWFGAIGAIHRFQPISLNVSGFEMVKKEDLKCFVSVGVNNDNKERAEALYRAGARYFIIDIAHGHSKKMKETIDWMRTTYSDIIVMAGNVATLEGVVDLYKAGAQIVKVGIGPGNVCLTKNVTGVTRPQFSAVMECAKAKEGCGVKIVADGGVREIGDIVKALGAGADAVMSGRLFANCEQSNGPTMNGKKVYRGMASIDSMRKVKDEDKLPTPEGTSILIDEPITDVKTVIEHIKGGLQSAFSYCNATNLDEFRNNVTFGLRR